jgi:hypothetical protein
MIVAVQNIEEQKRGFFHIEMVHVHDFSYPVWKWSVGVLEYWSIGF